MVISSYIYIHIPTSLYLYVYYVGICRYLCLPISTRLRKPQRTYLYTDNPDHVEGILHTLKAHCVAHSSRSIACLILDEAS